MRLPPPQYQVCDLLRLIGQFHFPKQFNHPITVLGTSGSAPVFDDPGFIRPFVDGHSRIFAVIVHHAV